ncbi:MAG: restriction endonuclease subunit S [Rhodoferax sp.]|nr:restriction endonuclease subunit S [Rhodoferax sp.]
MSSQSSTRQSSNLPYTFPKHWQVSKLRDVCLKIGSGATPTGGQAAYLPTRTGWALIRSQNVFDRQFDATGLAFISDEQASGLQGVALQSGDVLLNITGDGVTFSRSCQVPMSVLPAVVNQHVSIVRPDPQIANAGYVLAYLTHPAVKGYIEGFNAGGSRRALTKAHIESFEIPLPPMDVQHAIAHILGTLDDKIELNRRMNETLEAMARAIFQSWFVDFDPVRAKASGESPGAICQRQGLTPELLALFPDSFEDSELGEIPKGWSVVPLTALSEKISKGTTPSKTDIATATDLPTVPFIKVRDITELGDVARDNLELIPVSIHERVLRRSILEVGDILFSIAGTIGRLAIVDPDLANANANQAVAFIRLNDKAAHLGLCLQHLKSDRLLDAAKASIVQAVQANVSLASLGEFQILIPSTEILDAWNKSFFELFTKGKNCSSEARVLESLRDTLLPRMLSGELVIPSREDYS